MTDSSRRQCVAFLLIGCLALIGCGGGGSSGKGPATEFLNAYEKTIRTYEAKAASGGSFTLADISAMNADNARMAEKAETLMNSKKGGMSASEMKRYEKLTLRFSEALAKLSQKIQVRP